MTPTSLVAAVGELSSLPEVYYRAQELLADPSTDSADLGRVIGIDTAMTAKLLRLVNSAFYGLPRRIGSIDHAVSLVGRQSLSELILASVVMDSFSRLSVELVDMSTFWHHSVYTALVAKSLARRSRMLNSERMFTAGLLHDVGQLILYQSEPELSAQILQEAPATDEGVYQTEMQLLGFSHADVGAALMEQWQLPQWLSESIECHHSPALSAHYPLESSILHLANAIANQEEPGRNNIEGCSTQMDPQALRLTGFCADDSAALIDETNQNFRAVLQIIVPEGILI